MENEKSGFSLKEGYSGEIKQIIVITDGKSNIGMSPVEAARQANKMGIVVSAIGIVGQDSEGDEKDIEELEGIARAGGGLCDYTHLENLGRTVQLMTQKTAQKTIEQIVSRQLKSIVGVDIQSLEPKSRFKIVEFIEKYGESINLKCVIALDASGSMKNKLPTAKKSLLDLLENLKTRKGRSTIAVITYPGMNNDYFASICNFTDDTNILKGKLESIRPGGGTPTGPAINAACELIFRDCEESAQEVPASRVSAEELKSEVERYYV